MGKLTLGDLAAKHTAIKDSAQKHGINIIGVFGSIVGEKDFQDGDLQLLISWEEKTDLLDEMDFILELKNIFKEKGDLIIYLLTTERINKSVDEYVMTETQAQEILSTAKVNPLDKLIKQFQEQESHHRAVFSIQFFSQKEEPLRAITQEPNGYSRELPTKVAQMLMVIVEMVKRETSVENLDTTLRLLDSVLQPTKEPLGTHLSTESMAHAVEVSHK